MTGVDRPLVAGRDPWSPPATADAGGDDVDAAPLFGRLAGCGRLDQPGGGNTLGRFGALADAGRRSLSAGRLLEAHADAQSILLESGWDEPETLGLLGVWASDRHGDPVTIGRTGAGTVVNGTKPFCSGAPLLDHALVTAVDGSERRLCLIDIQGPSVVVHPSSWTGLGMRETQTRSVELRDAPVIELVGGSGWYLDRPGFWHGAVGVAASWFGGALGVLDTLRAGVDPEDPHQLAHLGEAEATGFAAAAALERTAHQIDADPADVGGAHRRALLVRRVVAPACLAIVEHTAGALGPRVLAFDGDHARRAADLDVYVRQDHGRHDAEALGRLVAPGAEPSC